MKKLLFTFLLIFLTFSCKAPVTKVEIMPPVEIVETDAGTYEIPLYLVITKDTTAAKLTINSFFPGTDFSYSLANIEAETFFAEGFPIVIWLQAIPSTPAEYGTFNHELFHMTSCIMQYVNIPLSEDSEEAWAYEFSYISKQFLSKINKLKSK